MRRAAPLLLALVVLLPHAAMSLDADLYARLLSAHTRAVDDLAGTRVDYAGLRADPAWRDLVDSVEATDPALLPDAEARKAFWINAYNVLAIDLVVQGAPRQSIRDLGSFLRPVWKRRAGRIDGRPVTLDEIEHGILRPMGDPRIHAAIVCASLSCPPLLREPYRGDTLDAQLEGSMRRFLADPRKGLRVDRKTDTLYLSSIFDWFADDFDAQGGVLSFVTRYAPEADAAWLREHGSDLRVRYLPYDWSLNRLS